MAPRIALGAAAAAAAFTDVSALGRGATRLGFVSAPPAAAQRVSAADSARSSARPPSAVVDGCEGSLAAGAGLAAAAALAAAAIRGVSQRGRPSARRLVACAAEAAEAGAASAEGEKAATEKPAEEGSEEEVDDSLEPPTAEKEPVYDDEEPTEEKKATKWTCSGCGAMNFAESTECSKCGANKPSEEEEAVVLARNEAKDEVGKTMDELIRLQADLQNYRRKHDESMSRAQSLGKEDTLRKLVPIMDDIEQALVPPENMSEKETAIFTSYSMLTRKVSDVFEKLGVSQLETEVGQKFSPGDHLKVAEREAPGDEAPGTIVEVLKLGYGCEGKVIIPSEVAIVAFPPEETETKAEEAKDEAEEGEDAEEGGDEAKEEGEEKADDKEEVKEGAK